MRIVNFEEFLKLPEGTIFSKYNPINFNGLKIKGETLELDFLYQDLIGNIENIADYDYFNKCNQMQSNNNISFPLDFDCMERDGLFDENQLFAIYEKNDIEGLIKCLQDSLKLYNNER